MPVYTILQLIFFVTEVSLLIFKRSKRQGVRSKPDKNSLLILWIVIVSTLTIGPFSSAFGTWPFASADIIIYAGEAVFAIGFLIRWTAVVQLGKMFTVDVAIDEQHTLKTNGLYNIVRHPSYLGLILIIAGLGLCMNSALSIIVMVIPTFLAINYRIAVEEKALREEFGEKYTNYSKRIKRIIPYIY
jgi:protein-S-isoprenylcysteine O-methyltransferase Ste14